MCRILTLKKLQRKKIKAYICNANKERRLVVKPVHLKFQLLEKDY